MKSKSFLVILLLAFVTFSASTSYALLTPEDAASESLIAPYIERTKQRGESLLSGRYAHVRGVQSRVDKDDKIYAPSNLILEIGQFNSEYNAYEVNFDPYGEDLVPMLMVYDDEGPVPMMKFYAADEDDEEYENMGEYYVVIVQQGRSFFWRMLESEGGDLRLLLPLNDYWYPEDWQKGSWKCSDGSEIEFSDNKVLSQGRELGSYIISDNRIAIKAPNGERDVIFAAYDSDDDTLILTFTSGPDDMGENAGVFTRTSAKPAKTQTKKTAPKFPSKEKKNSAPKFPTSQKKSSTNKEISTGKNEMPTSFPKMPDVKFPQQTPQLEGVWGAVVNGQQIVMQFKGNQYYAWINSQPAEMGTFQLNGNIYSARTSAGINFQGTVNFDQSGNSYEYTYPDGSTITYQRME